MNLERLSLSLFQIKKPENRNWKITKKQNQKGSKDYNFGLLLNSWLVFENRQAYRCPEPTKTSSVYKQRKCASPLLELGCSGGLVKKLVLAGKVAPVLRVSARSPASPIHYCPSPFKQPHIWEIGSRVGRNQATVMHICDRWMQEGTTDRRGRSNPPQCTTSREDRQLCCQRVPRKTSIAWSTLDAELQRRLRRQWCDERRTWVAEWNEVVLTDESRICLQHHDGRIRVWRHHGERMLNSCVMHHPTGLAPGIMVCGGIGYHSHTPLVRIAGTLISQRYISEVLESVVLPYLQGLVTAIFQQDNA
ncbi:hypothetical protein TNCV_3130441 [Trichonephila clavipes]|nr:hypothetical protein TNCV_3130441 [Trichonephila clavipes]